VEIFREIGFLETLRITPDRAQHRWPGFFDDQDAAFAFADRVAGFVNDIGNDAGQG
jgi:hypothetical protein